MAHNLEASFDRTRWYEIISYSRPQCKVCLPIKLQVGKSDGDERNITHSRRHLARPHEYHVIYDESLEGTWTFPGEVASVATSQNSRAAIGSRNGPIWEGKFGVSVFPYGFGKQCEMMSRKRKESSVGPFFLERLQKQAHMQGLAPSIPLTPAAIRSSLMVRVVQLMQSEQHLLSPRRWVRSTTESQVERE